MRSSAVPSAQKRRSRGRRGGKTYPIVFLTAAATKAEVYARGGKVGGLPFLAKPVQMSEIIACLKQHLGG